MSIEKTLEAETQRLTTSMTDRLRNRLSSFKARIGRDFQCPHCWLRDEARFALRETADAVNGSVLRCDRCGSVRDVSGALMSTRGSV